VHIVQRDESLSQIAQQYGLPLDELRRLNAVIDPNRLQIGQRLLIPPASVTALGGELLTPHTVEAGQTALTIARQYNADPARLAALNTLSQADSLYIGQALIIPEGSAGPLLPPGRAAYRVQAGDTWPQVALRQGVNLSDLARLNGLDMYTPLQAGQVLILPPNSRLTERFIDLPPSLSDVQLGPLPLQQGQSLGIYLKLSDPGLSVSGQVFDRPLSFFGEGPDRWAFMGVHPFTEAGIYPLTLNLTAPDGTTTLYEARLRILTTPFRQEIITLDAERQALLDPALLQTELDFLAEKMTPPTPQKFLSGLMNLPSTGPVTSQYGTRRSYDGGANYDAFHGGADFGGPAGTPITAPADGLVVVAGPLQVRGNVVIIDHGWGVYTGYWHNREVFVQEGQLLRRGDIIASLGATGLVTGAHLHWEMWVGGVQVDPLQWLTFPFDQLGRPSPAETAN
jgi:murein DD-endopeptidase MepM/ murein hydrolase activator NlpD